MEPSPLKRWGTKKERGRSASGILCAPVTLVDLTWLSRATSTGATCAWDAQAYKRDWIDVAQSVPLWIGVTLFTLTWLLHKSYWLNLKERDRQVSFFGFLKKKPGKKFFTFPVAHDWSLITQLFFFCMLEHENKHHLTFLHCSSVHATDLLFLEENASDLEARASFSVWLLWPACYCLVVIINTSTPVVLVLRSLR
jgi:hypothetical protein